MNSAVTRFQILRGTTAQRLAFIPRKGELVYDTENGFLYVGDGISAGGQLAAPLAANTNKVVAVVRNESGVALTKTTPVYISGATVGGTPLVAKSLGSGDGTLPVLGLLEADLPNNATGICVLIGEIGGVDTSLYTAGDRIYLAPTGGITKTRPVEPNFIQTLGRIGNSNATTGTLNVRIGSTLGYVNLPGNHVAIGQVGGYTTTVDFDARVGASPTASGLAAHIANVSNPHSVTKAQVGLGNVDNTSDVNKPVSTAQATAIATAQSNAQTFATNADAAHVAAVDPHPQYETAVEAQAKVDAHANRTDNPHAVTKAQVGLGNVDNTSDVNKPVSTAQAAADTTIQNDLNTHKGRVDNPHTVTKAQVGLGNVDNTSDVNKPVSTAQQTALNLKYDASNPNSYETPTQLNNRDTQNRARANHTGTQLSSTISDFANAVLTTALTGISFASTAAVVAADSVLAAIGKLQAQITQIKQPATTMVSATGNTTTTSTTDVLMTGMTITPPAGIYQVIGTTTMSVSAISAVFMSVWSGGAQVAGSQVRAEPTFASGGFGGTVTKTDPVTVIAEVTVNGSQAIELRHRTSAGTLTSGGRTMIIRKVVR